jgi:lipid-A-disaccharide synthase-like uncharacterized protein
MIPKNSPNFIAFPCCCVLLIWAITLSVSAAMDSQLGKGPRVSTPATDSVILAPSKPSHDVIVLGGDEDSLDLTNTYLLEDKNYSAHEVYSMDWALFQIVSNPHDLTFGFDWSVKWLKYELKNKDKEVSKTWVFSPLGDRPHSVEYFLYDADGNLILQSSRGPNIGQSEGDLAAHFRGVSVSIPPEENVILVVRTIPTFVSQLGLRVSSEQNNSRKLMLHYLAWASLFGVLFALLFYNLFLYFTSRRDPTYLWYIGYLLSGHLPVIIFHSNRLQVSTQLF